MNLTYLQLLRGNRNFRNLLWGQIVSELGNWFNFIAGLGVVRVVSDASPMAAGILFACRLLPFAVFSPIAGTFVDRFSRRQVMIWSDLVRVVFALMFLFVTSAENLWIAYFATVLLSVFGAFFEGAKNATTPNLTGKEGLLAGTALMFSTRFLLMAIGSALGGFAAAFFGYKAAFIINAVSFAVSAFSVWLIPEEATREKDNYELRITNYESEKTQSGVWNLESGISTAVKKRVKRVMWERVGILRDKEGLKRAIKEFEQISEANLGTSSRNFVSVAILVTKAALWREESRGGHFRTDFPERDESWRVHSIQKLGTEINSSEKINFKQQK